MGLPTRIENAYELLDRPREWYLDRCAGWIYYKPARGENLATRGRRGRRHAGAGERPWDPGASGSNLRFKGLTFAYATWMGVSGPQGYADDQTGFHVTGPDQPQTFEHARVHHPDAGEPALRLRPSRDDPRQQVPAPGRGRRSTSTPGVSTTPSPATASDDISAAAIQLGGVDAVDNHPTDAGQVTRDNRIANNTITKAAQEFFDAAAIFVGYTTRTTIIHNSLSNLPYSGIAIGWGWGMTDPGRFPGCTGCPLENWKIYDTPTTSKGNKILYNKISDYLKVAYDGGGIYSLGQQGTSLHNGELIAGNVVFGKAPSHGGNALYTDGGSRYITLRGNAAFDNPTRRGRSRRSALRARLGRLPALRRHRLGG